MPYNRISITGSMATAEKWSCSLNYSTPNGVAAVSDQADLTAWVQAVHNYLAGASTAAQTLRTMLSTAVSIDRVRGYYYSDIGQPAGRVAESTAASVLGSGTVRQVPQAAIVASLLTGIPGRRNRGRIYWPAQGVAIAGNFRVATSDQVAQTSAFAQLLRQIAVAEASPIALEPVVVSGAAQSVTVVTSVSVGDVIDTQRRRRDGFAEIRNTVAVPAS